MTRLKENPPEQAKQFWEGGYPAMHNIAGNLKIAAQAGYSMLEHFVLPEKSWLEKYYGPLQKKVELLKEKYRHDPEALQVLAAEDIERNLYQKYANYYGYVFYVMRHNTL